VIMSERTVTEQQNIDLSYSSYTEGLKSIERARKILLDHNCTNIRFDVEIEYGYYDEKRTVVSLKGERPENTAEMKKRLKDEEQHAKWRKHQYQQLKKEFEGK